MVSNNYSNLKKNNFFAPSYIVSSIPIQNVWGSNRKLLIFLLALTHTSTSGQATSTQIWTDQRF